MLKDKIFFTPVFIVFIISNFIFLLYVLVSNDIGSSLDFKFYDYMYAAMVEKKLGPGSSEKIVYIIIDDETYENYFQRNIVDRNKFSNFLDTLSLMSPSLTIIDIIFAYPQDSLSDKRLVESIDHLDCVFIPVSFATDLNSNTISHVREADSDFHQLKANLKQSTAHTSVKGGRMISPFNELLNAARGIGHITELPDDDGVYRRSLLFIEKDSLLIPSLYLAAFLDFQNVPLDSVEINWGNEIVIPAIKSSWLNEDIIVPIDEGAKTLVPFIAQWGDDFTVLSLNEFMKNSRSTFLFNELSSLIEGKTVVVGDASTGIADISHTPIKKSVPLLTLQANMINALFTSQFIHPINKSTIYLFVLVVSLLLTFYILIRNNLLSYLLSLSVPIIVLVISWAYLLNLIFLPSISLLLFSVFYFGVLLITVQVTSFKNARALNEKNLIIEYEMEEARKIQLSMLPKNIPKIAGYEVAVKMETASFVGGDYYDFFMNEDGSVTLIIADATGHGLSAGTMVTIMKSLFTSINDYSELHSYLNLFSKRIKILKLPKLYMCAAIYKISEDRIIYSSAGMPPLLIFRSNAVEEYLVKGPPLGFKPDFPYEIKSLKLYEGDILLLFSDGIIEQFNTEKNWYGIEKLKIIVSNNIDKCPSELVELIIRDCKNWSNGSKFDDDVTLMVIKKTGSNKSRILE